MISFANDSENNFARTLLTFPLKLVTMGRILEELKCI